MRLSIRPQFALQTLEQSNSYDPERVLENLQGSNRVASETHPPRYRIEREASEERAWQQLVNVFRRLAGLRINRTGQQAYDAALEQAVRP
jgi:hypothetical protein